MDYFEVQEFHLRRHQCGKLPEEPEEVEVLLPPDEELLELDELHMKRRLRSLIPSSTSCAPRTFPSCCAAAEKMIRSKLEINGITHSATAKTHLGRSKGVRDEQEDENNKRKVGKDFHGIPS